MIRKVRWFSVEFVAVLASVIIFWIPLYFVFVNAMKDSRGASLRSMSWPTSNHLWSNIKEVVQARDYMLIHAFVNSAAVTVVSIIILLLVCSMAGFVMQRRSDRFTPWVSFFVLAGLIIPPAIVPTIWVLDQLHLFKTMIGLILVEVALSFPFAALLYRGFMGAIPREIDEAAIVDGAGGFRLFFQIIYPLLKPVNATIIVSSSVTIFNDFTNPLYFFPGAQNATVPLTLYNFMGQFVSQYNLLYTNLLLITIPPLVLFIVFNKKIVAGITAGAVKG